MSLCQVLITALPSLLGAIVGGVITVASSWTQGKRSYLNSELSKNIEIKRDIYSRGISHLTKLKANPDCLFDEEYRASLIDMSGLIRVYASKDFSDGYLRFGQLVFDRFYGYSREEKRLRRQWFCWRPIRTEQDGPTDYAEELTHGTYDDYEQELERLKNEYLVPISEIQKILVLLTGYAKDEFDFSRSFRPASKERKRLRKKRKKDASDAV